MRRRFMTSTGGDCSRIIRYTSSDGKMVELNLTSISSFGAAIKTHTYSDDGGLIEFDASPTQIPASSFSGSTLKTIVLPNSIIRIGNYAFKSCTSLESVELGDGEITYYSLILKDCDSLKRLIFKGLNPSIANQLLNDAFDNIGVSGISVYYPTEDATYITKVIQYLDKPATADVNNFFPVTLVSGTTTVIGKELYERCVEIAANSPEGTINLPGTVMIDGSEVTHISYFPDFSTTMDFIAGTNEYRLYEDGYLKYGM